jgi:flagellar basal-body rod modification protein FlgD
MTTVISPNASTTTPTAGSTTASTIAGAQKSLASDQSTFLKLLTAQLKNQDPLSPMDENQFTQQLVAMTGVQQQIVSNTLLQQLVNNQGAMSDPVALIGKAVTSTSTAATLQNGVANWGFSLPSAATGATITVTDSRGNVVAQQTLGPQAAGEHMFSWNGQDLAGSQLADGGSYNLTVSATDPSGATVPASIYLRGLATAVQEMNGTTLITVAGTPVPLSSITTVAAAP